jgi:hypothetical protein
MKPEYEEFRAQLLEKELSHYAQPRDTISIPYLLKGKCYSWSQKFVERFPHLTLRTGFYGNREHYWCTEPDGTIVDPTIAQFHDGEGDPRKYRLFDETKDRIYLGKCMNCGQELYGLKAEGRKEVCETNAELGVHCQQELERYYNNR